MKNLLALHIFLDENRREGENGRKDENDGEDEKGGGDLKMVRKITMSVKMKNVGMMGK